MYLNVISKLSKSAKFRFSQKHTHTHTEREMEASSFPELNF